MNSYLKENALDLTKKKSSHYKYTGSNEADLNVPDGEGEWMTVRSEHLVSLCYQFNTGEEKRD